LSREPWNLSIRTRSASFLVGRGDQAAVAEGEQVLGREEAEGRGDAGRRHSLRTERLRGVLDDRDAERRQRREVGRGGRTGAPA
jgi:hypothetical protein